ncbi:hypothetical protein PL81_07475 [Streptomyces sp. RSD-27]|nr:hypothetical protein PL81_07475 [Streptomyces sp. RSD-27]
MRTRLLGFIVTGMLAILGFATPAAPATPPSVDSQTCMAGGGTVDYDSGTGLWTCVGGTHDREPISP